jgi:ubiquinone/menaquinone biosynthesis C-methylase UbiE
MNHQYLLNVAAELDGVRAGARVLDYGCGKGEIVEEGIRRGLQIYGADIFYHANPDTLEVLRRKGLLGDAIREIRESRIPFEDNHFDLVISNMVFEHVENMESVLGEIDRVLKPGGLLVAMFPTQEVWREAHIGIPFAHWFKKGSRARYGYALALRSAGFGNFKTRPFEKWVADMLSYLDTYCYYRTQETIENLVSKHFAFNWMEAHHLAYRIRKSKTRHLAWLVKLPVTGWLATRLFTRMAYVVLAARKPGGAHPLSSPPWLPRNFGMGRRLPA